MRAAREQPAPRTGRKGLGGSDPIARRVGRDRERGDQERDLGVRAARREHELAIARDHARRARIERDLGAERPPPRAFPAPLRERALERAAERRSARADRLRSRKVERGGLRDHIVEQLVRGEHEHERGVELRERGVERRRIAERSARTRRFDDFDRRLRSATGSAAQQSDAESGGLPVAVAAGEDENHGAPGRGSRGGRNRGCRRHRLGGAFARRCRWRPRRRGERADRGIDRREREQRRGGDRTRTPRARRPRERRERDREQRSPRMAGPGLIREVPAHGELGARDERDPPEQTRGRHGARASYPR